jgi:hypothetical protein
MTWSEQRSVFQHQYNGTAAQSVLRNVTSGYLHNQIDTALVVRTTTGGASWQEQRFGAGTRLLKVVFVDSLHGWISSYSNFILRTRDGGATWEQYPTPMHNGQPVFFFGLDFIDTLNGWGGYSNLFYKTTNGGASWQFQYEVPIPPEDFSIAAMSFPDSLYGWAFGEAFYQGIISEAIYRTTNSGTSWYRESIGLTSDLGGLSDGMMLDRTHGWAVAGDGRVLAYRPATSVVERLPEKPQGFKLRQNYPNPFNLSTSIEYELSDESNITLHVVDNAGRIVSTLVHAVQSPGVYRVRFDGTALASGAYYYRLKTDHTEVIKQMLLLK